LVKAVNCWVNPIECIVTSLLIINFIWKLIISILLQFVIKFTKQTDREIDRQTE